MATGTEAAGLRVWEAQHIGTHGIKVDSSSSHSLPSSSKTPSPHGHNIAALAWSPVDPKILVSGCKAAGNNMPGSIAVWDVTKGSAPLATFKIPGDVLHLAFHPGGRHFATVCPRQTRDEVLFFWLVGNDEDEHWEQRTDIMMGGAGIDIGVEEVSSTPALRLSGLYTDAQINSLRFWLAGDAVMSVSNDGSLTSWWYPTDERPPLARPDDEPSADERPAKKSRTSSPEPEAEGEAEREPVDGEGREVVEGEEGDNTEPAEGAEGQEAEGEGADNDIPEVKIDAPADGDIEMAEPSSGDSAVPSAAPSPRPAVDSAAPSAPATAPPSRQPTPPPQTPSLEDTAAANAAKEAAMRAAAAAEFERRKHRQLARCFRQVPHVASLLALAIDPLGRCVDIYIPWY